MRPILVLISLLTSSVSTIDSINQRAHDNGLEPVLDFNNGSVIGNPDYKFEGFGVEFKGLPIPKPRLTFFVHFKKNTPQWVRLGKFYVPIASLDQVANIGALLSGEESIDGSVLSSQSRPSDLPIPSPATDFAQPPALFDSYLKDRFNLKFGDIDTVAAARFSKEANIPASYVVELQTHLTSLGFPVGEADGWFGSNTRTAVRLFQQAAMGNQRHHQGSVITVGKTFSGKMTGEVDAATREEISLWLSQRYQRYEPPQSEPAVAFEYAYPPVFYGNRQLITTVPKGFVQEAISSQDIKKVALEFDIEIATLRSILEVEAGNNGFLLNEPPPARPKIRFEAHVFHRQTSTSVSRHRPDLSTPDSKTSAELVLGGSKEWNRLLDAMEWDPVPAMKSTAWGVGQVMGFDYKAAGCSSLEQFVIEAHQSEMKQIKHMMNVIRHHRLIVPLQKKRWRLFAEGYNGPDYEKFGYHIKLEKAYDRWRTRIPESPTVALTDTESSEPNLSQSSDDAALSKNFKLKEFLVSGTALRLGIDNTPTPKEIDNLRKLCQQILQPARDVLGPLRISSGFRSERLNVAVGGAPNSDHRLGFAADVIPLEVGTRKFAQWVTQNCEFDQVILEFGTPVRPKWIHVSAAPRNRKQILRQDLSGTRPIQL